MMFEVLNLSKDKTILKVLRMKKKPNRCKKKLVLHVSDSMDELSQLSIIIVR